MQFPIRLQGGDCPPFKNFMEVLLPQGGPSQTGPLHALYYPFFPGATAQPAWIPQECLQPLLREGAAAPHHGASEASRILKPGGTAGTIWAQVQGLQDTIAVQEALPCRWERGGNWGREGALG